MKFVVILIIAIASGVITNNVDNNIGIAEVDALLTAVTQERWHDDEKPCFEAVVAMLNGVRKSTLWATWMWDSNQRPMGTLYGLRYQLGNFDQCLNPPWLKEYPELRPQYCLLDLQLSDRKLDKPRAYFEPYETAITYINTKSERGRHMNMVTWGLCLPSQCSMKSVSTLGRHMMRTSHLMTMTDNPTITVNYCHLAGETRSYGFGAQVFFAAMLSLVIIAVAFTYYRQKITPIKTSNYFVAKVVESFCLKTNYAELFVEKKDEISSMNGIRFITSFCVVWAHAYMFSAGTGMINALDLDKIEGLKGLGGKTTPLFQDAASQLGIFIHHMDIVVDSFFAFSALLHVKSLLSNPEKPQNLVKIICKRYVRLVGAMAVAIALTTLVSGDIDNGPLWQKFVVGEQDLCVKNWWRCLLMLNTSAKEFCLVVTWYISCDFQMTIISTIIFYIYRKNKRSGIQLYGILSLLSLLIPGFLAYWYTLRPVITSTIQDLIRVRMIASLDYTYVKTYSRAGAYMAGMASGFLIATYKPAEHKKVIPKIWSFMGTLLAVSAMLLMITIGTLFYGREYSALEVPISVAMNRVIWACAVCGIIGLCVYGDLPLINDFLSCSFFRPLSRLSYGIYLLHTIILERYIFSIRAPFRYDHFTFIIIATGATVMTTFASLFVWLIVEAPLINISNYLLADKIPQKTAEKPITNGETQNNHKKIS